MSYQPVKRFGPNAAGRDIVVGDVHGFFRKLQVALDEINFDPSVDRLFSVGDLVDRGPDSEMVIEWLDKPWFHAVAGNHEEFCLGSMSGQVDPDVHAHPGNGGAWFVAAPHELRQAISRAFFELPVAIEIESPSGLVGIVHAECPTHTWTEMVEALSAVDTPEYAYMRGACQWGRKRFELGVATGKAYPVGGVRAVISGHTVMRAPTWLANSLLIDTGAWLQGRFTLIDLASLVEATRPVKPPRDLGAFMVPAHNAHMAV